MSLNSLRIFKRIDVHMREIMSGAATALTLKLIGAGFSFFFSLLLARMIGRDGAGVFFLALAAMTIATVVGRLGLDNTILRFVAANASVSDWCAVKGVYNKCMGMALSGTIFVAVSLYAIAPWLASVVFKKPETLAPIRWLCFAVVPMSLIFLHSEALKGLKRVRDSMLVHGVGVPILSVLALLIVNDRYGVVGVAGAQLSAVLLTLVFGVFLWHRATPQLRQVKGEFDSKVLLASSVPLFWVTTLGVVNEWTPTFALGIWGIKEDIGVFGIASRTSYLMGLLLLAINTIAAPKFAALIRADLIEELETIVVRICLILAILSLPFLCVFTITPEWVMGWFGEEFRIGGRILSVLAIGQFVSVTMGPVGPLLMMSGNESLLRKTLFATTTISILLNFILVPNYGVIGAAIASSLSVAIMNLIAAFYVWKRLKIKTFPAWRRRHA